MSHKNVLDDVLCDPLSDVTRVERRWLLVTNIAVATMAFGGIVPSEIDAFGLRSSQLNQSVIFAIVWLTAAYFFAAFMIYGAADYKTWKRRLADLTADLIESMIDEYDRIEPGFRDRVESEPDSDYIRGKLEEFSAATETRLRSFRLRAQFEIRFPMVFSLANLPAALLYMAAVNF